MDEENINELEKNSDEESSNVPEPETNSDSHETNMELDSQGKSLLAVGSKALIAKLLKAKILSIVLIGGGIFFLFIVIIGVLFGSEVPEYQYVEPSIDKVTVTYDPYGPDDGDTKTYDLEEYVRRALYAYIDDIPREEEGNFHLYSALVIALRTEALSKDGQITYRDKDLSKDYEERPEAEEALKTFEGIIITDKDDNYIDVSVSSFCWHEENADDYLLYQKDLAVLKTFTNVYLHNNIYATCPCNEETGDPFAEDSPYDICWVTWDTDDDGIDDEAEYKHTDNEDGFSFYGAYYELKGQGYLYTHILESFFGKDIYYRTTIEGKEIDEELGFISGNTSSMCNTASDSANLMTFLNAFEGTGQYCDNGNGYLSYDGNDGTITVGHGVTNYLLSAAVVTEYINQNNYGQYFNYGNSKYYLRENECIPVSVVDQIKLLGIDQIYSEPIENAASKYGVTLTQYQKDAITSFNYNLGSGYTERLIESYANGGYEGLWNYMKQFYNSNGNALDGLKKRRKAEFALFVTGDYTDRNLFYSRNLTDYDNYNSEGVMEREAICRVSSSGFALPLPSNSTFYCSSPYGFRIHPITGIGTTHSGLDLAVAGGTDIYAAKDGTVTKVLNNVSGKTPSTGNMVRIKHEDGTVSDYYHMQKGSVTVNEGDYVKQGQVIGKVGSTGASTGNHLHFTIYDNTGSTVDPYDYLDLSMLSDTSNCHL